MTGLAAKKIKLQEAALSSRGSNVTNAVSFFDSYNWSGWLAGSGSGNGFKSVQGSWNVQCFSGPQSDSIQETTWVGLGGDFSNEGLVQTGTFKEANGNVYLFWEAFNANGTGPNNGNISSNHVNIPCSHAIHAVVMYHPSGCSNGFTTQVQDVTGGTFYNSGCLVLTGGHESSEWIDERPDCGTGNDYTSLADFNYTRWSNVLTQINTGNSGWSTPLNYSPSQSTMQDSLPGGTNDELASPDGITINSNNTFEDQWYAYGNYYGLCSAA